MFTLKTCSNTRAISRALRFYSSILQARKVAPIAISLKSYLRYDYLLIKKKNEIFCKRDKKYKI